MDQMSDSFKTLFCALPNVYHYVGLTYEAMSPGFNAEQNMDVQFK